MIASYHHLDRRTGESWSGSSYVASYTDLADQLTQASDGVATYAYGHDGLGRATTITSTLAGTGLPGPVTFTQGFDLAGTRTQLSATIAGSASPGADFVNQQYATEPVKGDWPCGAPSWFFRPASRASWLWFRRSSSPASDRSRGVQ